LKVIHYDNQFNANEWFVIISIVVGLLLVFALPKRFSKKTSAVYLLCGVFIGFFFDHTLSVLPVSFYDLNDSSRVEWTDFLSHVMYGSYSYFFFYLYDYLKVTPRYFLIYILVWAFLSAGIEKLFLIFGVFHYRHGYNLSYSFIIYLIVLSLWVAFHHIIKKYGERKF